VWTVGLNVEINLRTLSNFSDKVRKCVSEVNANKVFPFSYQYGVEYYKFTFVALANRIAHIYRTFHKFSLRKV